MKKLVLSVMTGMIILMTSCDLFGPVDPIGPAVATGDITDQQQTSFKVTGTISDPDYKNNRQRKKSGKVVEYGFAYGTSENPGEAVVRKVGDTVKTFPLNFEATISGLAANTTYRVWAYAKNETGILTYGNESGKQTSDYPDPNPGFTFTAPANFRAPAQIQFTTVDNTPGAVYHWEFGDGTTSNAKNPTKDYLTGGTRSVKLTISANGKAKSESKQITIDNAFTRVTITKLVIRGYLATREDGQSWDRGTTGGPYLTGGPDLVLKAGITEKVIAEGGWHVHSNFDQWMNVTPAQLNNGLTWNWPAQLTSKTFNSSEFNLPFEIYLIDWDNASYFANELLSVLGGESMGLIKMKLQDFTTVSQKYPNVVTLQGTGGGIHSALKVELTFKWE